jgi:mercuric ion binding protein
MKNKSQVKQGITKIYLFYLILPFLLLLLFKMAHADTSKISGNDKTVISLPSIVCESCVSRIEKAVKKIDGVTDYKVDLDGKTATVTYDNTLTTVSALETAITAAGYDANDKKADEKAFDKLPGCCKAK